MRMHILLEDELVAQLDALVGKGGRSRFVVEAVRSRLEQERRWEALLGVAGSVADAGHDWDADPAAWVTAQRHADPGRVG